MSELGAHEPVDDLHALCLGARDDIRAAVRALRQDVLAWEPRPMPASWRR